MAAKSVTDVVAKFDDFTDRADRKLRELQRTDAGRAAMRRMEKREGPGFVGRLKRAGLAVGAVAVAALILGMIIGGIGIDGFILMILAMIGAGGAAMFMSKKPKPEPEPTVETIINAELGALPVRVERWLAQRRSELPSAARVQVDELLLRLEILAPQLEKVDADAPVVTDARRLIGDELPRLVTSYLDVPQAYRTGDGEADKKLVEGLGVVSDELKRLSEQLAKGDLDRLAIEGRFLETKYRERPADA